MADPRAGFFCKSFEPDFPHLDLLLTSFWRHNPDGLRLTLSLPQADLAAFRDRFGTDLPHLDLIADESYCDHDLGLYRGWHGQQICKFMSWNAVAADHYAVLDSDCYFITDVRASDLLPAASKSYVVCGSSIRTVIRHDNPDLLAYIRGDLRPAPSMFPDPPLDADCRLTEFIHFKTLDLDEPGAIERSAIPFEVFRARRWMFYQPGQIFSRALLLRFRAFLDEHGLSFGDCILISPWEYNWYGEYAAFAAHGQCDFRISPFAHFQDREGIAFARSQGLSSADLARSFLFVQMAARHLDEVDYA